ncbi:MAG: SusE domain-containing protein [Bacteroidetes bacterium]|nr:SusE domain-containing protein [Bacteroidota bacterium]
MKRKLIIYIALIGIIGLLSNCKKDETKVVLSSNPVPPTLTLPDNLTLLRTHAGDTLTFTGTAVDPGFNASANYFVEACKAGSGFTDVITLFTGVKNNIFKISAGDLNNILLKKLPADEATSLDFRVRSVFVIDAGTGYTPIEVTSAITTATVTTYGPPTLALTTAGTLQGVISPTDNGFYSGWIYTDGTPFHFTNKDNGKNYGGDAGTGVLTENGPDLTLDAGAYNITVDLTNLSSITMTKEDVTIGIIGDAVGGWDNDTKMVFNFTDRSWNIHKAVTAGGVKFRTHGGWNKVNVAYRPNNHDLNNLYQSHGLLNGVQLEPDLGDSQNIDDIAAGNYDIKFFLESSPMKAVFTPAK